MTTLLDGNHALVRKARADASRFFAAYPALAGRVYEQTYEDVRVRVFRDGRVLVFDAKGNPLDSPLWDSHTEPAR